MQSLLLAAPLFALTSAPSTDVVQMGLGAPPSAPQVNVLSAERSTSSQTYGYDYDYDDGESAGESSDSVSGSFDSVADLDTFAWYGQHVGHAVSALDSTIDANGMVFDSSVTAETFGELFSSDAGGTVTKTVTFSIDERVRYRFVAVTSATYGYNGGEVSVRAAGGALVAQAAAGPFVSAPEDVSQLGWLEPGTYTFELETYASAGGQSGAAEAHSASADGALLWYSSADFDADGTVDGRDLKLFTTAFAHGDDTADINGDGDTDLADWRAFARAWRRG